MQRSDVSEQLSELVGQCFSQTEEGFEAMVVGSSLVASLSRRCSNSEAPMSNIYITPWATGEEGSAFHSATSSAMASRSASCAGQQLADATALQQPRSSLTQQLEREGSSSIVEAGNPAPGFGKQLAMSNSEQQESSKEGEGSSSGECERASGELDGAASSGSGLKLPPSIALSLASRLRAQVGDTGSWGSFCSTPDGGSPLASGLQGRLGSGVRASGSMLAGDATSVYTNAFDAAQEAEASGAEADAEPETPEMAGSTAPQLATLHVPQLSRWQSGGGGSTSGEWGSPVKTPGGMGSAAGFNEISRKISSSADMAPMSPPLHATLATGADASAMPAGFGSPGVTMAAMLAAESLLAVQAPLLEAEGLLDSSDAAAGMGDSDDGERGGGYTIASAPDVSTRPSSGRQSRRMSRNTSITELADATDEGMLMAIADIPQPLSSRRSSRTSNRQLPADGPLAAVAAAGTAPAAPVEPFVRSSSSAGRRMSRAASSRLSADQDWGLHGGSAGGAGVGLGGHPEAGLPGDGLHVPAPYSRRTSRTMSGGWCLHHAAPGALLCMGACASQASPCPYVRIVMR